MIDCGHFPVTLNVSSHSNVLNVTAFNNMILEEYKVLFYRHMPSFFCLFPVAGHSKYSLVYIGPREIFRLKYHLGW